MMTRRSWLALLVAAGLTSGVGAAPAVAQSHDVLVFAAASLKNALDEVAAQWQRESGKRVAISYAASNTLIKQIEQGAPADIFSRPSEARTQQFLERIIEAGRL